MLSKALFCSRWSSRERSVAEISIDWNTWLRPSGFESASLPEVDAVSSCTDAAVKSGTGLSAGLYAYPTSVKPAKKMFCLSRSSWWLRAYWILSSLNMVAMAASVKTIFLLRSSTFSTAWLQRRACCSKSLVTWKCYLYNLLSSCFISTFSRSTCSSFSANFASKSLRFLWKD